MVQLALAFLTGVCLFQWQAQLPAYEWLYLLPVLAFLAYRLPRLNLVWVCMAGFLWSQLFAYYGLEHRVDRSIHGQNVIINGTISSIPAQSDKVSKFEVDVNSFSAEGYQGNFPRRVKLSWYYPDTSINAGEYWQLEVRIKPPSGVMNPAGFDYEGWLFQKGIDATGYVKKSKLNRKVAEPGLASILLNVRQALYNQITTALGENDKGILKALAIGYRKDITPEVWSYFIGTGTNHLIAISGLHIGLVAGLALFLLKQLSRLPGFAVLGRWRVRLWLSLYFALIYALLAGFTVPTQRALIMLTVLYTGLTLYRTVNITQTLAVALIAVLLFSPLSVLSPGFWFSFLAVGAIGYSMAGHVQFNRSFVSWLRPQFAVVTLLVPLSLFLFQQTSLISIPANLVAIPLVGFIVVPGIFISTGVFQFSVTAGSWLFKQVAMVTHLMVSGFEYLISLSEVTGGDMQLHFSSPTLVVTLLATAGLVVLIMPAGLPARYSGLLLLLPLITYSYTKIEQGAFRLSVIDVGQGLSVLVQTSDHALLFDSGPRFRGGFNAGEQIVLPVLRHSGVQFIDKLVISNGDNDHIGGAQSIIDMITVNEVQGRDTDVLVHHHKSKCHMGQRWNWDGVTFEFLHPDNSHYRKRNNHSCVLRISTSSGKSALIAADIEAKAERRMLKNNRQNLKTSVLVAPHHGSKGSSSIALVKRLNPEIVIYSAGYLNRYRFPRPEVVERYAMPGVQQLSTAESGLISINFRADGRVDAPAQYRKAFGRYWNHQADH